MPAHPRNVLAIPPYMSLSATEIEARISLVMLLLHPDKSRHHELQEKLRKLERDNITISDVIALKKQLESRPGSDVQERLDHLLRDEPRPHRSTWDPENPTSPLRPICELQELEEQQLPWKYVQPLLQELGLQEGPLPPWLNGPALMLAREVSKDTQLAIFERMLPYMTRLEDENKRERAHGERLACCVRRLEEEKPAEVKRISADNAQLRTDNAALEEERNTMQSEAYELLERWQKRSTSGRCSANFHHDDDDDDDIIVLRSTTKRPPGFSADAKKRKKRARPSNT